MIRLDWWNEDQVATLTGTAWFLELRREHTAKANADPKLPVQYRFPKGYKLPCQREADDG